MKEYKVISQFVDENLLNMGFILFNVTTHTYRCVNSDEFNELVKNNEVQHFVWDEFSNKLSIFYSKDEKVNNKSTTLSDYLDDCRKVPYYYSDYVKGNGNFLLGICEKPGRSVHGVVIPIILVGSSETLQRMCDSIRNVMPNSASLLKENNGIYTFLCPMSYIRKKSRIDLLFSDSLISTEMLKRESILSGMTNVNNTYDKVGKYDVGDLLQTIELFDDLTYATLNKYSKFVGINTEVKEMNLF